MEWLENIYELFHSSDSGIKCLTSTLLLWLRVVPSIVAAYPVCFPSELHTPESAYAVVALTFLVSHASDMFHSTSFLHQPRTCHTFTTSKPRLIDNCNVCATQGKCSIPSNLMGYLILPALSVIAPHTFPVTFHD